MVKCPRQNELQLDFLRQLECQVAFVFSRNLHNFEATPLGCETAFASLVLESLMPDGGSLSCRGVVSLWIRLGLIWDPAPFSKTRISAGFSFKGREGAGFGALAVAHFFSPCLTDFSSFRRARCAELGEASASAAKPEDDTPMRRRAQEQGRRFAVGCTSHKEAMGLSGWQSSDYSIRAALET